MSLKSLVGKFVLPLYVPAGRKGLRPCGEAARSFIEGGAFCCNWLHFFDHDSDFAGRCLCSQWSWHVVHFELCPLEDLASWRIKELEVRLLAIHPMQAWESLGGHRPTTGHASFHVAISLNLGVRLLAMLGASTLAS